MTHSLRLKTADQGKLPTVVGGITEAWTIADDGVGFKLITVHSREIFDAWIVGLTTDKVWFEIVAA